jgi:hypothetical protein
MQFGPKIVRDGMVLCIDAASATVFPRTPVSSGLVMWMDASDAGTFTYSSGTTVSQWNDKSGSGYHMTVTPGFTGPARNTRLNNIPVLNFSTSQSLRNTSINLATSAYTVFIVSRYSSLSGLVQRVLTSVNNNWLLGHWNNYYNQYFAEGWVQYLGYAGDTTWRMYMGDWSGSGTDLANLYSNGTIITSNSTGASAGPNGLGINANEPSSCQVAEILVYNKVLSTTERKSVHTYLSRKWGLSNPDYIIYDESANGNNGSFENGAILSSTNGGVISLDGTNDCVVINSNALILSPLTYTKIAWFYPTSFSTANNIISGGNVVQHAFWLAGSNKLYAGHANPFTTIGSNTTLSLNTWYCGAVTFSSTAGWVLYLNGRQENTNASTTQWGAGNGELLIGAYGTGLNVFTGRIACASVYNRVLSASEILQNFNALRGRFGI